MRSQTAERKTYCSIARSVPNVLKRASRAPTPGSVSGITRFCICRFNRLIGFDYFNSSCWDAVFCIWDVVFGICDVVHGIWDGVLGI